MTLLCTDTASGMDPRDMLGCLQVPRRDDDEINPADEPKDAVQLLVEAIIWSKMLLMRMRKPP